MRVLANFLVALIALEHFAFLALEMIFWQKPLGLKVFHTSPDFAAQSAVLAANQGLYNGFLAVGLLWALISGVRGFALKIFFLLCVIAAGLYGGWSANPEIYFIQAAPAALALLCVLVAEGKRA